MFKDLTKEVPTNRTSLARKRPTHVDELVYQQRPRRLNPKLNEDHTHDGVADDEGLAADRVRRMHMPQAGDTCDGQLKNSVGNRTCSAYPQNEGLSVNQNHVKVKT